MKNQTTLPRLLIISDTIRRDLHSPLRLFKKFQVVHLYKNAGYRDMTAKDFQDPRAVKFDNPFDLFQKLVEYKPDIIQAAEPWANRTSFLITLTALKYVKKHPVKMVLPAFENIPLKYKLSRAKYFLCRWLVKKIDPMVQIYFALNRGAQKNLESLGVNKKKIKRVMWGSWGVNLSELKPKIQKEFSIFNFQFSKLSTILFLGRVSRAKGIPQLLEAIKFVETKIPQVRLIIAGLEDDAIELVKNSPAQYIGAIKNQDVADFLSSGAVLVMPSQTTKKWEEQVGMVGLQALACGVPVVATRSGSIPEYFRENSGAILVGEKNIADLANAIIKLMSDKKFYARQSTKARRYIKERFDQNEIIAKIENTLLNLEAKRFRPRVYPAIGGS